MTNESPQRNISPATKTAVMGAITLAIYVTLFSLEGHILNLTSQGKWSFVIPIGIAFTVSYFHGAFTSGFWDALGVKAKK